MTKIITNLLEPDVRNSSSQTPSLTTNMCLFFGFLELLYHAIFSSIQLCFIKISSPTPSPSIFLDLWHDIFQFSPFDLLNFNIFLVLKGVLQHKMIEKAGVKKSCLDLVYFSRTNRIVHNLWKWVLFCIWSLVPNLRLFRSLWSSQFTIAVDKLEIKKW